MKHKDHIETKKFGEPSDVHVDAILTNISIKYMNDELIANTVMPIVPVSKRSDKYYVYDRDEAFRIDDDTLGPKARPNEIDMKQSTDNYSVVSHGLADYVGQEEIDNADAPLQPLADATENLRDKLLLAHEFRVATVAQAPANYASGNKVQLSGTSLWTDKTNATPLDNVLAAVEGTFKRANVLVMGKEPWLAFRVHPQVLDAVKNSTRNQGAAGGFATEAEIIALLEIQNIVVGRARYNTTKKGQTASYSLIWGNNAMAFYTEPSPGIKRASWGYTYSENPGTTFRAFDGKRGEKGATYIKDAWNSDRKIVAADLGYLIEDAI